VNDRALVPDDPDSVEIKAKMAYTVLARKYRSQTFDDVIGQDPVSQTLKNAIKTGRVAHAYLFTGTRGIGKTTMARILAKALNCLSADQPTTEPCCKCDSCTAINLGEDIDVIEIDGATNNGVEQVRELRQNAIYRPARSRFKIYIIDEVHMLTVPAFNALLKILEEPPSHVKFIFATTEPNKVIPTIQSRCQRFDFSNISPNKIADQLKSILAQEKIRYDEDLVLPLAKMANGSMRDGLSLLDRLISTGTEPLTAGLLEEFLGCPESEKVWNLVAAIGDSDAGAALAAVDALLGTGISEVRIVDALTEYMRDLMVAKSAGAESDLLILTTEQRKRARELAEKFDIAALVYAIATLERLRWSVKNSDSPRPLLEAATLRFALSEHFINLDELLAQMQGRSAPAVKKKQPASRNSPPQTSTEPPEPPVERPPVGPAGADLQSIKESWPGLLKVVGSELGAATAGLLSSAVPSRFENDVLTLEFGVLARMQMQMCQRDGRQEQIRNLLSKHLSRPVGLKLEIAPTDQAESPARKSRISAKTRNEILSDPAVKTVLTELGAIVTNIEED
jgi:DNA polymerase-3 subunit gamma/tau